MIRRDFLQAEITKLEQALNKIIGLKEADKKQEADDIISKTLIQDFDLNLENLIQTDPDDFKKFLSARKYSTEKLNLLGKFLIESISPFQQTPETFAVLNYILTIYQILEQEHHTQSFENLNQQQIIIQYLNQNKHG